MTTIVEQLDIPAAEIREALNRGSTAAEAFHAGFAEMRCLDQIEQVEPDVPAVAPLKSARIVFWNAERLKYPGPSVDLLRWLGADAYLLCELDLGMARSGNLHTTKELAEGLGAGYVFGTEFVELDLGDARERASFAGKSNAAGLHGAGLLSRRRLERARLLRLETSGRWFDGAFGERRVGGRIAIMAELEIDGTPVLLASVHYESHTDPADRLALTQRLLDEIDSAAPGRPVLIGGDFNTATLDRAERERPGLVEAALIADPERFIRPMAYEPMFEVLAARGYDWESCNVMGATTQRIRPDGTPEPPLGRIDWFFARGLDCADPSVLPAVDEKGFAISDQEVLAVTVRPARP